MSISAQQSGWPTKQYHGDPIVHSEKHGRSKVPEEHFESDDLRVSQSTGCGGQPTVIEVWNGLEDVAIRVESPWPTHAARRVLAREQDDLGVDKIPGGDSLVQSFTKSSVLDRPVPRRLRGQHR